MATPDEVMAGMQALRQRATESRFL
ncbi:MAG: hypothetical protein ACREX9_06690 [Gammaproteobacteria bacterium]